MDGETLLRRVTRGIEHIDKTNCGTPSFDLRVSQLDSDNAEYVSHEKGIPPRYFDAETFRTRYAALLWKHGTQKNEIGAVNDDKSSDKPVRPQFGCESSDMIIIP
ncbi:hypothetical protein BC332_03264 [Capsicum chinense]|nr:hypothetical protein BC332_03264 [Capsicum chinense]